jgi:hypothetical protein
MSRNPREQLLCLWCGTVFHHRSGDLASYCGRTHKAKANYERRIRRKWTFEGCDAPHARAEVDRGLAVAYARQHGGELLVCKCGNYHVVPVGEGGRSPELEKGEFIDAAGKVNDEALDRWLFDQHDKFVAQEAESLDLEAGFQESLRRARVLDAQERGATGDKRPP